MCENKTIHESLLEIAVKRKQKQCLKTSNNK